MQPRPCSCRCSPTLPPPSTASSSGASAQRTFATAWPARSIGVSPGRSRSRPDRAAAVPRPLTWRLSDRNRTSVRSWSMTEVEAETERHLPFDTVFNFRDLGGYPADGGATVKWRTLFRADGMHRLTIDDLEPLQLRTVLDLRTVEEHERGRFTHDSIGYHHLPILQAPWDREAFTGDLDPVAFLSD